MNWNVLIATFTDKQYKPQERMENVFKPILYPLVKRFLEVCKLSGEFLSFSLDNTQIDRMFYGVDAGSEENIANVFSDPLDAVEIIDLKVKFAAEGCSTATEQIVADEGGFPYVFEKYYES